MTSTPFTPHSAHNFGCESAAQADCHCQCRGAGHQYDLVARAVSCSNSADLGAIQIDLARVFGGFHANERDVSTATRGSRGIPSAHEIASMSLDVRKGATWLETLLVDEALHSSFVEVARTSVGANDASRRAQADFIVGVTLRAIGLVRSPITFHNVVESHVWCSIVSEFLAGAAATVPGWPAPTSFAEICYPRRSRARLPSSLPGVRAAGLVHLAAEFGAATAVSSQRRLQLLRLVGAATCPDLWHHPAAVRYCLEPFVSAAQWPPSGATHLAVQPRFSQLRTRWNRKGHW